VFSNQYFKRSVQYVKGVGESRAKTFLRLGLKTVGDLVQYFPRDYEDRTITKRIAEVQEGDTCSVVASLAADITESRPRRNLRVTKALVTDGSGFMNITWFNQDYIKRNVQPGQEYVFFGPTKRNGVRVEMQNPVFEPASGIQRQTGQIMPIYPLTHGITQNVLRSTIKNAISGIEHHLVDILPPGLRSQHKLAEAVFSYEQIHFPKSFSDMEAARKRLVFQELLLMQLGAFGCEGEYQ
jgi:ATP-dependent DNA helicase RecG